MTTDEMSTVQQHRRPVRSLLTSWQQPLYRSGYALVASSAITSGIGLLYWVIAARLYPPAVVGTNSAAIYAMMFLAGAAQLNLMNALLRFVPVAGRRARGFVITTYTAGALLGASAGYVFVLGARLWSSQLEGFFEGRLETAWFVAATAVWTIFVMQDSVLTAVGRAALVPVENAVFSGLKIVLLVWLVAAMPFHGVAVSWTVATAIVVVVTNVYLFRRAVPSHMVTAQDVAEPFSLRHVLRYVGGDYTGTLFWLGCTQLLPVLVLDVVGAEATAAFSTAWTVAYSLYLVPLGMGQSLVVHASRDIAGLERARRIMVEYSLLLLVPAVVVIFVTAPYLLRIFGESYSQHGTWVLRLAALSALPNIVTSTTVSAARVRRRMTVVVAVLASLSILVLTLCVVLTPRVGVNGVGIALLAGQMIVASAILLLRASWLPRPLSGPLSGLRHSFLLRRTAPVLLGRIMGGDLASWRLQGRLHGQSGTATALVGSAQGDTALIKVADSPSGRNQLVRQAAVLRRLHADGRLGAWRDLLPNVLATSEVNGAFCVMETRLRGVDGRSMLGDADGRRSFVAAALGTIEDLHDRTAVPRIVDEASVTRWVRVPIARLRACVRHGERGPLDRLEAILVEELAGRRVSVGWVHGDFCPDNVLVEDGRVTGVVDWCQSDPDGIAVLDVVGLLVSTEWRVAHTELGRVVQQWSSDPEHPGHPVLVDAQRALGADVVEPRVLVLLSWLHHVSNNLAQSERYSTNPLWMHHNVVSVLRSLERS
ncbi:MAG TPA: phosphotransferase [Pseudonocardiaceae bacterium]|nr:phosphotransferase [Pseudonocardiaceae bacterium]